MVENNQGERPRTFRLEKNHLEADAFAIFSQVSIEKLVLARSPIDRRAWPGQRGKLDPRHCGMTAALATLVRRQQHFCGCQLVSGKVPG
jgi:hypothetical protein